MITYTTELNSIGDFNAWSGGRDTLDDVIKAEKVDELDDLAEEIFGEKTPTATEINDWLWFDRDEIYKYLGMNDEDEDEEE